MSDLLLIAWVFFRIGLLAFGGSTAILPELERQVVQEYGWLTRQEFADSFAFGQLTPGPALVMVMLPGYRLAGKTGTAQIPTEYGYDAEHTNASFIGWGPVDDPQFMVYIWLQRPSSSIWASETAAPVFAEVAEQSVILLNIPPDVIRSQLVNR